MAGQPCGPGHRAGWEEAVTDEDPLDGAQVVDRDAAEQRITEPATHDDAIYQEQLEGEEPDAGDS